MRKTNISIFLILLSLFITSCSEPEGPGLSTSPEPIEGAWDSGEYIYTMDCISDELTFDEYILEIILYIQENSAQEYVDWKCGDDFDEEFTDDNGNGEWDEGEEFTDDNGNGEWSTAEEFCDETPFDYTIYETNADSIFAYALNVLIIPEWNDNPS